MKNRTNFSICDFLKLRGAKNYMKYQPVLPSNIIEEEEYIPAQSRERKQERYKEPTNYFIKNQQSIQNNDKSSSKRSRSKNKKYLHKISLIYSYIAIRIIIIVNPIITIQKNLKTKVIIKAVLVKLKYFYLLLNLLYFPANKSGMVNDTFHNASISILKNIDFSLKSFTSNRPDLYNNNNNYNYNSKANDFSHYERYQVNTKFNI